jgi:hypothetical protein
MEQILQALGKKPGAFNKLAIFTLFFVVTLGFSLLSEIIINVGTVSPVTVHLSSWVVWFFWQGWWFPASRRRLLKSHPNPYIQAFWCDILPGVAFGVSLMTRPVIHSMSTGTMSVTPVTFALGFGLMSCGIYLLWAGFSTIGLASAGFFV